MGRARPERVPAPAEPRRRQGRAPGVPLRHAPQLQRHRPHPGGRRVLRVPLAHALRERVRGPLPPLVLRRLRQLPPAPPRPQVRAARPVGAGRLQLLAAELPRVRAGGPEGHDRLRHRRGHLRRARDGRAPRPGGRRRGRRPALPLRGRRHLRQRGGGGHARLDVRRGRRRRRRRAGGDRRHHPRHHPGHRRDRRRQAARAAGQPDRRHPHDAARCGAAPGHLERGDQRLRLLRRRDPARAGPPELRQLRPESAARDHLVARRTYPRSTSAAACA